MPLKNYPYLNRLLKNLKGEIWREIPEFEYYQISNYGRVKSLSRCLEITTPSGGARIYWTKELILKQSIGHAKNNFNGEDLKCVKITFTQDGISTGKVVARLVYQVFINGGAVIPSGKLVIHIDGDNLNNNFINLALTEPGDILKTSFARKRRNNPFAGLSDIKRKEYSIKSGEVRKIPVTQYDFSGKLVQIFSSIEEASQKTGICHSNICNVLSERGITAGKFIWVKGRGKANMELSKVKEWLKKRNKYKYKSVIQYSLEGKKIAVYPSIQDAAKAVKGFPQLISHAVNKRRPTAYKFKWKFK
jgi:hypothetical protein